MEIGLHEQLHDVGAYNKQFFELPQFWTNAAGMASSIFILAGVLVFVQQDRDWSQYCVLWLWGLGVLASGCLMPRLARKVGCNEHLNKMWKNTEEKLLKVRCIQMPGYIPKIAVAITLLSALFRLLQVILWIWEGSPQQELIRTTMIPDAVEWAGEWTQYWMVCISAVVIYLPFFEFLVKVSEARVGTYIANVEKEKDWKKRGHERTNTWDTLTSGYIELGDELHHVWNFSYAGAYVLFPCVVLLGVGAFCAVNILRYPGSKNSFTVGMAVSSGILALLVWPLANVSHMCMSRANSHHCIWSSMYDWISAPMPTDERLSQIRLLQILETHTTGIQIFGRSITREVVLRFVFNLVVKLPAGVNIVGRLLEADEAATKTL